MPGVAPPAGARIETIAMDSNYWPRLVAPPAGARIETGDGKLQLHTP